MSFCIRSLSAYYSSPVLRRLRSHTRKLPCLAWFDSHLGPDVRGGGKG